MSLVFPKALAAHPSRYRFLVGLLHLKDIFHINEALISARTHTRTQKHQERKTKAEEKVC